MVLKQKNHSFINVLLALHIHKASSRISDQRSLFLAEDASRITHNQAQQTKQHDYISIFGSQKDAIVAYSDLFKAESTQVTSPSSETDVKNSTMVQSLQSLGKQYTIAPTDDPTSIMLLRREKNSFVDGRSEMDDTGPNARDVSNAFGKGDSILNSFGATDMLWAFGQFINHDISLVNVNAELCNVEIPPNDPYLDPKIHELPLNRSTYELDETSVAQQVTNISSSISCDNIYGNTRTRLEFIRAHDSHLTGRLRTSGLKLLPKNTEGLSNRGGDTRNDLFLAGDVRANENLGLTVMHTLWMREHNYWADALHESNPELSGDELFAMARVIVQAEAQKIVYDEFLPALLGEYAIPPYEGYNPSIDARLENIVSSCALRIGHTMVGPTLHLDFGDKTLRAIKLEDAFFVPSQIEQVGGIDAFLRGMANNVCQEVDPFIVPALRNHLFANFDLLAVNIQRARDHGIPDFNSIRESLGFEKLGSFNDFLFHDELASVYSNADQIDCWVGMNSEPRIDGLMVGQTQRAVLARNFANIRDGDPNFYKNSIKDRNLLEMIERTRFADVIRRNSDNPGSMDDMRDDLFFIANNVRG